MLAYCTYCITPAEENLWSKSVVIGVVISVGVGVVIFTPLDFAWNKA